GSGSISNNGIFTGFLAGTYSIIVTDVNGCTSDSIFSISEPLPIAINSSISGSICSGNNGTISLTASGGTAPYQFSNNNGSTYQSSNVFSNLNAGNYPISIADANGCTLSQSLSVIDSPGPLVLSVSSTNVTCNGYTDGIIAIATTSGTAPLSYQINNGTPQLGSQFIALPAGNYNILVADANGCTATTSSSITQPQPISISAAGQTTICIGQSATISAIGAGGNGGYVYTWSNGFSNSSQNVSPGTTTSFTVSVTDSLGCPGAIANVAINVNPPLQLVITPNDTICEGQSSTIVALASGGDGGPYNYQWTGMTSTSPTQTVSPVATTSYTVSVTNGCTTPFATAISQVMVNPLPAVDFSLTPYEGCAPLTVSFSNNSNAGVNPQYYWDFGDNSNSTSVSPTHTYTEPGIYGVSLKAVSAAGCSRQISFPDTIHVWPVPIANILATPPVASILYPVIQFRDGGVGADSWLWDFGDGSAFGSGQSTQHSYELPNIYDVTL
ncbi:MAG: PKD domain-containing protein, partial [Bacteroidota bacterium]